jgi:hypothetical protein
MDSECIPDELWVIIQQSLDPISSVALRRVCHRMHRLRPEDDVLPPLLQYVWDRHPTGDRTTLLPAFYELVQTSMTILSLRYSTDLRLRCVSLALPVSPCGYTTTLKLDYFPHMGQSNRWAFMDYGTREDSEHVPCWMLGRSLSLHSWEKEFSIPR